MPAFFFVFFYCFLKLVLFFCFSVILLFVYVTSSHVVIMSIIIYIDIMPYVICKLCLIFVQLSYY